MYIADISKIRRLLSMLPLLVCSSVLLAQDGAEPEFVTEAAKTDEIEYIPKEADYGISSFAQFDELLKTLVQKNKIAKQGSLLAELFTHTDPAYSENDLDQLRAHYELIIARFNSVEKLLDENGANQLHYQRLAIVRSEFSERLNSLLQGISKSADSQEKNIVEKIGTYLLNTKVSEQLEVISIDVESRHSPILRLNDLPYQSLSLPTKLPTYIPEVLPTYLDSAAADQFAQIPETQDIPDSVFELARELKYNLIDIYEFVHTKVETEFYFGVVKGGESTLKHKSGNSSDQAILLSQLFRASGIKTTFIEGVIELSLDQIINMTGTNSSQSALDVLRKAGIPHKRAFVGGKLSSLEVAHSWLSVKVPYSNYRGATVDLSGEVWLPLMPAIKTYSSSLSLPATINVEKIFISALDNPQNQGVLESIEEEINLSLELAQSAQSIKEVVLTRNLAQPTLGFLPSSLPARVIATTFEGTTPPQENYHLANFKIFSNSPSSIEPSIDHQLRVQSSIDHDLTITYQPASQDDHNLVLSFGGLSNTPLYLIKLRPVLRLSGKVIAVGTTEVFAGQTHKLELNLQTPYGSYDVEKTLVAGGFYSLGLAMGASTRLESKRNLTSLAEEILGDTVAQYASRWSSDQNKIASYGHRIIVQPVVSVVFAGNDNRIEYLIDQPVNLNWQGINIDAALWVTESVPATLGAWPEREVDRLTSLHGSWLEHQQLKSQFNVEAISADKAIALANHRGQVVLTLAQTDISQLENLLSSHPIDVQLDIINWLNLGYTVSIPQLLTKYKDWMGSAWIVENSNSGDAGYFLARGLAGGATVEMPVDQFADSLRNPDQESPPDDQVARATLLQLFAKSDFQQSAAGKTFEPLLVRVLNDVGAPIKGAIVRFGVVSGEGTFDVEGQESNLKLISVLTNERGIAEATYRSAEKVANSEIVNFIVDRQGDVPKIAGTNIIAVEVDRGVRSPLAAENNFTLYTVAGQPDSLVRLLENSPGLVGGIDSGLSFEDIAVLDEFGNLVSGIDLDVSAEEIRFNGDGDVINTHRVFSENCEGIVDHSDSCGSTTLNATSNALGIISVGIVFGRVTNDGPEGSIVPAIYPVKVSYDDDISIELAYLAYEESIVQFSGPVKGAAVKSGDLYKGKALAKFSPRRTDVTIDHQAVKVLFSAQDLIGDARFTGNQTVTYFDQPTAPQPGSNHALVEWNYSFSNGNGPINNLMEDALHPIGVTGLTVRPLTELRVQLDDNLQSSSFDSVAFEILPIDYQPRFVYLDLFEDGKLIFSQLAATSPVTLPSIKIDPTASYEAEIVVNKGLVNQEVRSDKFPVSVSAPIIGSIRDADDQDTGGATGGGSGAIITDEVNNATCVVKEPKLVLQLLQEARITLTTQASRYRAATTFLNNELLEAGVHVFDRNDIGFTQAFYHQGRTRFNVVATATKDGRTEQRPGSFYLSLTEVAPLPVGSPVYEDINLYRGNLFVSRPDVVIEGRGPQIEFRRSYTSSNTQASTFGPGWGHNYDSFARTGQCGWVTVSGGVAGGVTFFPNNEGGYTAGKGYHSSLEFVDGGWSFYTKDGTHYRYQTQFVKGFLKPGEHPKYILDYVQDPNGNTTQLVYKAGFQTYPQIDYLIDQAGRKLQFHYAPVQQLARAAFDDTASGNSGESAESDLEPIGWPLYYSDLHNVITKITGLNYLLEYQYDQYGRLVSTRHTDSGEASQLIQETYQYGELNEPNNDLPSLPFDTLRGIGITKITDPRGIETVYEYQRSERNISLFFGGSDSFIPFQKRSLLVTSKTKLARQDENETSISSSLEYTGKEFEQSPAEALVIDPRGVEYRYQMDNFGRLIQVDGPTGTKKMTWPVDDTLMLTSTDENGVLSEFQYDSFGNQTKEHTTGPLGGAFDLTRVFSNDPSLKIRNLLIRETDRRGNSTSYSYDSAGNLVRVAYPATRDCVAPCSQGFGYASNGDRTSSIDERGYVTHYRFDTFGNPTRITHPIGTENASYDQRSRAISRTDENGNKTILAYDWLNRPIKQTNAENGIRTYSYDSNSNRVEEVDEEGRTQFYEFDFNNRVIRSGARGNSGELVAMTKAYDQNGNELTVSDYRGNLVTNTYDSANRLVTTQFPADSEGQTRRVEKEYDNTVNLLQETVSGAGANPQTSVFEYDNLYRQTKVVDAEDGRTTNAYDGNGNLIRQIDELGRVSEVDYDARNLKVVHREAVGTESQRSMQWFYDRARNEVSYQDARGNTDQRTYDGRNRLIFSLNNEDNRYVNKYDDYGNLTEEIDHFGNQIRYEYDELHRRKTVRDQRGFVTSTTYDLVGNPIREEWPNSNIVEREYDFLNRNTAETDAIGEMMKYGYDADNNVTMEIDGKGFSTTKVYDALSQLIETRFPENRAIQASYDVFGNLKSATDGEGNTTSFEYDNLNRQTLLSDANSFTIVSAYDAVDNKTSERDKRGNTTSWVFDELNRVTKQIDPIAGQHANEISHAYDPNDNVLSTRDKRGIISEFVFDRLNRVVEEKRAGVTVVKKTYSEIGDVIGLEDANQNRTAFLFNERHEMIEESRPELAVSLYEYDAMGDLVKQTDPEGRVFQSEYDTRRRKTAVINGESEKTTFNFDLNNNQIAKALPEGNRWEYSYDELNRLVEIKDGENGITKYGYDRENNLLSFTDANSNEKTYEYDPLNRKTILRYPIVIGSLQALCRYDYDPNNNLISELDANGQTKLHRYDALNRRDHSSFSGGISLVGRDIQSVSTEFDGNNNHVKTTESYSAQGTGSEIRIDNKVYDDFDRLFQRTDSWGKAIQYRYDLNGNRLSLTDSDGITTTYQYDGLNRLREARTAQGSTTYSHDKSSLIKEINYPNNTKQATSYDLAGRTVEISNTQNNAVVSNYLYSFDQNGNRSQQLETNGGDQEATSYGYDDNDRLTTVSYPDKTITYNYDAAYNRTNEIEVDAESNVVSNKRYRYNTRNQLSSIDDQLDSTNNVVYAFDQNGNQIQKTKNSIVTRFTFDIRDDLREVQIGGSSVGQYLYDASGLRIEKIWGRGTERSTYDDQSILQQYDEANTTRAKFDYGANRLLSLTTDNEPTQFYLTDALQSVVNLTNNQGAIQARYQYDAWGNKRKQVGDSYNRFSFTGYEEDTETGLLYAKARFYDPDTGKFLSEDAWEGDNMIAPSLHRYLYAYQNPTVWVDPDGNHNVVGHYYVPLLAALESGMGVQNALIFAKYSQLPDEIRKYDAIANALSYMLGDLFGEGNLEKFQSGMHVLTGKNSSKARSRYESLIQNASLENPELLGFAMHGFADSYAHANGERMHVPLIGHVMSGKRPDQVHRPKNRNHVLEYASDLYSTIALKINPQVLKEDVSGFADKLDHSITDTIVYKQSMWSGLPVIDYAASEEKLIYNLRAKIIDSIKSNTGMTDVEIDKVLLAPEKSTLPMHGFFLLSPDRHAASDLRRLNATSGAELQDLPTSVQEWNSVDEEAEHFFSELNRIKLEDN